MFFGRGLVETPRTSAPRASSPPTRSCSTGSPPNSSSRLGREGAAEAPRHDVGDLPAVLARRRRAREDDPENRLLARGPAFRLPAELMRDTALAASGLLVEKIGGPSVQPYQPAGLWEELATRNARPTCRGTATTCTAAASTPSGNAPAPPPRPSASTRRRGFASSGGADEHAAAGAGAAQRRALRRGRAGARRAHAAARAAATPRIALRVRLPPRDRARARRRSCRLLTRPARGRSARSCAARPGGRAAAPRGRRAAARSRDAPRRAALHVVASTILNLDETSSSDDERPAWTMRDQRRDSGRSARRRRRTFLCRASLEPRAPDRRLGAPARAARLAVWRGGARVAPRGRRAAASGSAPLLGGPHFPPPRAKRVIYLFQCGGAVADRPVRPQAAAAHDARPGAARLGPHGPAADGHDVGPDDRSRSRRRTSSSRSTARAGAWVSELLPHTARDRGRPLLRPLDAHRGDQPRPGDHLLPDRARSRPAGPCMGAWLTYGLGSENENLPAFVVLLVARRPAATSRSTSRLWGSGFLPSQHQGVKFRSGGDPVLYLSNPPGSTAPTRRRMLDTLRALNEQQRARGDGPGDRRAHRAVRDGVPHAGRACPS